MEASSRRNIVSSIGPLTLTLLLAWPEQAAGEPTSCHDPFFEAEAADPQLAQDLCGMSPKISDALRQCGLEQYHLLTIEVVEELSHPAGNCLAYFDCEYDLIRLTDPKLYANFLSEGSVYDLLPAAVTLKAFLTHELAHALTTQSAQGLSMPIVDQEYIAAAMELELMDPQWRDVILDAAPVSLPPKEGLIDIWIYGFEPRKFAVNAWHHFREPENGCDLVRRMISGDASFSKAARPELR